VTDYVLDDRYTLIERIATGGMGEVWRGGDRILGRPVAIKMLAAVHADDEQFRARFRAEARYASSLAHPGITRVFDYGEHSPLGGPYLVMELVDGQPLSEILERYGRLDPYVVLDIVAQAARAMDAAHRAGIVHRDVKPGNILVAEGTDSEHPEHVYLTDFGLTKKSLSLTGLTTVGQFVGTVDYVAPEQISGKPVDGRCDVYSLACVVFECLAGSPPFRRDDELAMLWAHLHDPPPPLPRPLPGRPDLSEAQSEALDATMARALAKTPDERFDSCLSFVAAVRAAGTGPGAPHTGRPVPVPVHEPTRMVPVPHPAEPPPPAPPPWANPVYGAAPDPNGTGF
jgi:serine/threonine-protein kinase